MSQAVNKRLELDFNNLFDKISILRSKSFETFQAAQSGKEDLAEILFADVQRLNREISIGISDISRWKNEIKELGNKR